MDRRFPNNDDIFIAGGSQSSDWQYFVIASYNALIPTRWLANTWANDLVSSPPGENGRHLVYDILLCIFVKEQFCILVEKKHWRLCYGSD